MKHYLRQITSENLDSEFGPSDLASIQFQARQHSLRMSRLGWINLEYFRRSADLDGFKSHWRYRTKSYAVPYQRDIFLLSTGRFALPQIPVAYFADDQAIATCEGTSSLREKGPFTDKYLDRCLNGDIDPTPRAYGYSLVRRIKADAMLLPLLSENDQFIILLKKKGLDATGEFLSRVVRSRSPLVYPVTHQVSAWAIRHNFNGVLWESVRQPNDISYPSFCVVIFDPAAIYDPLESLQI